MRKGVVIFLIIAVVGFLMGFLLLKKNSPIIYLACKQSVGVGCYIDKCGSCEDRQEKNAYSPILSQEAKELVGGGCYMVLGYADSRGYKCAQVNNKCTLRKTWRASLCQSVSDVNSKWRINLGIENEPLFYYGDDSR